MLISEFARATGLSPETVRYYVRRNLLRPQLSTKGGRNPYQLFTDADVRIAGLIRLGQALGMTLREIASLLDEEQRGRIDDARSLEILGEQRTRLAAKATELAALIAYLDAKIIWIRDGGQGEAPQLRPPPAKSFGS